MSRHVPLALDPAEGVQAELLVLGTFAGAAPPTEGLPSEVAAAAAVLAGRSGWAGRDGQVAQSGAGGGIEVLELRGLGKESKFDRFRLAAWLEKALEAAASNGFSRVAVRLPAHAETRGPEAAERIQRLLMTCGYSFDRYTHARAAEEGQLSEVRAVPPPGEEERFRRAVQPAGAAARAVHLARELGNTPANEANPEWMEKRARELAQEWGLSLEVLDVDALEERGMGGILAVGRGSSIPPRLLRLSFGGEGPAVALVGKGVTFDTGGISIKPAASMDEMKYDKCGACTALSVATAVAELDLPLRLQVYLPLAENMPDGRAYRPGDIVRCYNGKTVEIINTDAEGRMILADALSLAVEEGAEWLVEFSTLTGACVVALGHDAAGLYSPDDGLAAALLEAARDSGERLWRMPLWPETSEKLRGGHADLKNAAGRWGSANLAAAFLSQFVGSLERWAHLDIAGPAAVGRDRNRTEGATGYGTALTLGWLRRLAEG